LTSLRVAHSETTDCELVRLQIVRLPNEVTCLLDDCPTMKVTVSQIFGHIQTGKFALAEW